MSDSSRFARGIPLRVVVTTPFLLLLAGTVGVVGWLLIGNGLRAADEMTSEFSGEIAERVHSYVVDYLETAHLVNNLNADAVLQGQLNDWNSGALGQHFWHQLQRFDTLSFVFLGTRHGGAAGAGRLDDGTIVVDSTPADPALGLVRGTRTEYRPLAGGERGPWISESEDFDATTRPWFRAAVAARGPVWSEVYAFFRDGETLGIAASRPVYDPTGELWGVLAVDLALDRVGDFLDELGIGSAGFAFIVEPDGELIATSTHESLVTEGAESRRRRAIESSEPRMVATARRLEEDPASEEFAFDVDGERLLVRVTPVEDPRGLDWRIVTVIPQADFLAAITPDTRLTIAACLLALILAMVLGVLISRGIARPVEQLTAATRAIASGELEQRVPGGSIGELADLGASFNRMTGQLKSSFAELEDRVEERTAALREATAVAVAANEAKTEFLATVSHEIRTPLSTILGYVDLLRDGRDDATQSARYLRTIRDSGVHLNHLVGDLLDVGRIEAGRLELDIAPCDLAELVAQLGSMFAARAAERGLTLDIESQGLLPWRFSGDAVRIRQIVSNLLSNAIRYTEEGSVRLIVTADSAVDEPESAELLFTVVDTGVGISEDARRRIFERFTQVDASAARRSAGFGLGLWIARQLTDRMGGRIEFDSEPGVGSTFAARLPVRGCSRWSDRQVERQAPAELTAVRRLSGRVLVAEDSVALRDLCRHMLERWGVECTLAANGREAIDRALAEPFDLILMDWQMPHIDGLDATRTLRRGGLATPIIALTAAAMHGDRERCLAAGCDRYLVKPIDFRALHRAMEEYLRGAAGRPDAAAASGNGDGELAALARGYLSRLPATLTALEQALDVATGQGDWEPLNALVHKLVGTSGSYGLLDVFSSAERLESAALDRDTAATRRRLDELARIVVAATATTGGEEVGGVG